MDRPPRISLTVTVPEYNYIRAYIRQKRRWRDAAALARDALFQHIHRNPLSKAQEARLEEEQAEEEKAGHAVLLGASGGRK